MYDLEQTRVYFVSAADQTTEYDCEIVYFGKGTGIESDPFKSAGLYFYIPTIMPVGKYDLRAKNGAYILNNSSVTYYFNFTITEPIKVALSQWNPSSYTVKGGDTFSVRGAKLDTGVKVSIAIGNNGEQMPLEIVSRTAYKATFKIPVGTPAGAYNRIFFIDENGVAVKVSKQIDVIE
ncbi:hypothetical protein [Flavobacterium seoulense]|uniref:IPT/TIG domain-containing protein n=1 Tax=Flavobacterium seoulense TaxID=1492738 RepID=A0A066WQL7_9FLAO|nr:hypothetical protein [Flavobacterium seoulense]KDN56141.1 hypothetical protein FEM21_06930 [Flavobacterium seoulense]